MACPDIRTAADDIADALEHLDHAERMLRYWRAHLVAQLEDPTEHRRWVIERVKNITVNTVIDAGAFTQQACERLTDDCPSI